VRTGGLFIAASPSVDIDVFVNDKHIKKTSLLSRSVFLQSLRPGEYTVRIEREDFRTWEKTISVKQELVSEVRALLLSDSPRATVLANGDFLSLDSWNNTTFIVESEFGKKRYFDTENNVFISPTGLRASTTPQILSEEVRDYITELDSKNVVIDQTKNRILWWDGRSVWIEWLPNAQLPFYVEDGVSRIYKDLRAIRDVQFYPRREAAIVTTRNDILVVEFDGRGGHIATPLYKGKSPKIIVPNPLNRTAYILDGGTLFEVKLQ